MWSRRLIWCVAAAAAALVAAASAWQLAGAAQPAAGCLVHGQVTAADGSPLAGVAVRFSTGLPCQVTDKDGRYAVLAPDDGEACLVTPSKAGYAFVPAERRVWLSGDSAEASFQAQPQRRARMDDLPVGDPLASMAVIGFEINDGAEYTTTRDVTLNNSCDGTPTHYQASELPGFTGATWLPYSAAPTFTLSAGNDAKTVYFRVGNVNEISGAASDGIILNEPTIVTLVVNGPVKTGWAWPAGEEDWYTFTVAATAEHTIETWAGTLADNDMALYAADQTTLLAQDADSGEGACAKIVQTLDPGTYFVRVTAHNVGATGTYTIRVTTGDTTVAILDPHGDPTATTQLDVGNAEVVFSMANPGVLQVVCRFVVKPGAVAGITDKVRACIEPVGDSALQWLTPADADATWAASPAGRPATAHTTMGKATYDPATDRYEVKAVFTALPTSNSGFGPKKLWAQVVDGTTVVAQAEQPLEVFFPKLGTNNPGTGRNAGPNWFYYWKTGNVCGTTTGWEYEVSPDFGFYIPGEDHVNLCDAAPTVNTGPEYYENDLGDGIEVAGQGIGPHCASETIAHEELHKWIFETWAPLIAAAEADGENDGDDYDDPDDDGIPNIHEDGFLAITTDPNDPDTYNMGGVYATYGDNEIRCRKQELDTGLTVTDADDWAYPGTNSCPPYPLAQAQLPDPDPGIADVDHDDLGNPGDDTMVQPGSRGPDTQVAYGGAGNDQITQSGRNGNDTQTAYGGSGRDTIVQAGSHGNDTQTAYGGSGNDHITQNGGYGNDTAQATGGTGDDTIIQAGRSGNDSVTADGGHGNDIIRQDGRRGTDTLAATGGDGNDLIVQGAGRGNDSLTASGGEGDDQVILDGNSGNDTLTYDISPGNDQVSLNGGKGRDTLTIRSNGQSYTILDPRGNVLYQHGTGGSTIVVMRVEALTVIGDDGVTVVYTMPKEIAPPAAAHGVTMGQTPYAGQALRHHGTHRPHHHPARPAANAAEEADAPHAQGKTPLHIAARNSDVNAVRRLVLQGADINATDKAAWTPLHDAAAVGAPPVVLLLLDLGADTNAKAADGKTPLDLAVQAGRTQIADILRRRIMDE
ncbi:MAG: hypothetical protein FJ290_21035 [Planctomycetes bacterium]|nr:hypothetical protein [Planctomycetota bacterium]